MEKIRVKRLKENAIMPTYGSAEAAGADLYACLTEPMTIQPGESVFIPTGLAMELPVGFAGLIYARSGIANKRGLAPSNKVGVVDSDYRGEIFFAMVNNDSVPKTVENGDRIGQLMIMPVIQPNYEVVDELDETERGEGGFGSTGIK